MRGERTVCTSLRAGVSTVAYLAFIVSQSLAAFAENRPSVPATDTTRASQVLRRPHLTKNERALQALNRFTFGPRPGDVAAVKKIGLDRWFDQQLHPESISDAALERHLQQFPAMLLSASELMQRFPPPNILRRDVQRQVLLSNHAAEHAIYASAEYRYQQQLQKAEDTKTSMDVAGMQQRTGGALSPVDRFQDDPETILALPPTERMAMIYTMPPEQFALLFRNFSTEQKGELRNGLTPEEEETLAALTTAPVRVVETETLEVRLLRDLESQRQLQAVMTDFWLNHFNVYLHKNQDEPYLLNSYERDTMRPHALGKFEDLLLAVAQSPAMQVYLDNARSIGPDSVAASRGRKNVDIIDPKKAKAAPKGINENYARELLELHTLGVQCEVSADKPKSALDKSCGGGYTQADVQAVAAVLTGWGITKLHRPEVVQSAFDDSGSDQALFHFNPDRHEPGDKQVQGVTIRGRRGEDGVQEGREVLHLLAMSPATAHFLCHKLAVRFLSDTPPASVESRMTAAYLSSGGDIAAVLTTLFHSPEFWSPVAYLAKLKTPLEFVTSAVRATGTTVTNPIDLVTALDKLGMPLYGMQTPNGYSWTNGDWVSANALINRMNFAMVLSGGLIPGTVLDWARLVGPAAVAAHVPSIATEHLLETTLVGQAISDRTRSVLLEQADRPGQALAAQQPKRLRKRVAQVNSFQCRRWPGKRRKTRLSP